jgi:hypothetical protein
MQDRPRPRDDAGEGSSGRCWSCDRPVEVADRYCRYCGQGQGAFLAWYYRPLWIVVLALTALGPFVLPLVWRTPSLGRQGKWLLSLAVVGFSAYIVWQLMIGVREIGSLLDMP